jgi:hypothetical protein
MEPEGSLPCSQEPSTGPILSQINPIHTIPSYLSKIHFVKLPRTYILLNEILFRSIIKKFHSNLSGRLIATDGDIRSELTGAL